MTNKKTADTKDPNLRKVLLETHGSELNLNIMPMLPSVDDRSINNPMYLLSAEKVCAIASAVLDKEIGQPANWYLDADQSLKVMNAIKHTASAKRWSEVSFKGGQALFVANIEIVK